MPGNLACGGCSANTTWPQVGRKEPDKVEAIVVGGGPAGMMAAGQAALAGATVTLLERNERLGKKLSITGKGRGNLTNTAGMEDFIACFGENGPFLYGALSRFNNDDLRRFFHGLGVPTIVERGGRVFPESQKASDLTAAMVRFMCRAGVRIIKGHRVTGILTDQGKVSGVTVDGKNFRAGAVVLCTGGASYPATGSTGDGYALAAALGHTVIPPRPALVPLETEEPWARKLAGLSLKNVAVQLLVEGKILQEEFGEMLFTHFGLSGPVVLTLSRRVVQALDRGLRPRLQINLKPALTREQLDDRVLRDFAGSSRRKFVNSLGGLLPRRLIEPVVELSGIEPDRPVHQISRLQRQKLLETLTRLTLTVKGVRPLAEAIVTAGGVSTAEINPTTMASRLVRGLFFAGEVIDVDGGTGGYNLQAAFSTGRLAGLSAAKWA